MTFDDLLFYCSGGAAAVATVVFLGLTARLFVSLIKEGKNKTP